MPLINEKNYFVRKKIKVTFTHFSDDLKIIIVSVLDIEWSSSTGIE